MKKQVLALAMFISFVSMNCVCANTNYSFQPTQVQPVNNAQYYQQPLQYPQNNTLQGNVVMVPAGATVKAMLTSPLSSEYTTAGQTVSLALNNDFYYLNTLDGLHPSESGMTIIAEVIENAIKNHINTK